MPIVCICLQTVLTDSADVSNFLRVVLVGGEQ